MLTSPQALLQMFRNGVERHAATEVMKRFSKICRKAMRWHGGPQARRLMVGASLLLPLAGAALVYYPSLSQWFFTDDFIWLEAASNPDFPDFVKGAFAFPRGPTPYWRPLIDFYFFGMYRVFSLEATGYHVANLLLHGGIGAMVVLVMHRLTRSLATGALAGVLFAVTPSYWTSVVWVSAATTLIAVFFFLLTVLLFLWHLERDGRLGALALATVTFAAALLAKEVSLSLPAVLFVLGLAMRPPTSRAASVGLALSLLPFAAVIAGYLSVQYSQVYLAPTPGPYELGWHAVPNLLDRLLWLSLPLRSSYAGWVDAAQWAVMLILALAAGVAMLRRHWVLPALLVFAIVALVPSSFFTKPFNPRWVYLATVPWAGFVATFTMLVARWLSRRHVLLGAAAIGLVIAGFVLHLLPATMDAQRVLSRESARMREIGQVIQADCSGLGPTKRLFVFPLPVTDPGYAVPTLARFLYPGTEVLPVQPPLHVPVEGDCVLDWALASGAFRATNGEDFVTGPWWNAPATAPCPDAIAWEDAASYIGKVAMVRGPIVEVHDNLTQQQTVLKVGEPGKFLVVIRKRAYDSGPLLHGEVYIGSTICVVGPVVLYRGLPLLIAENPSAVAIATGAE